MTRDTHDDLFISYQILNVYIGFLEHRINMQIENIGKSLSRLHPEALSNKDQEYIFETYKKHHEDSMEFKNMLTNIQRRITALNDKYPNVLHYYSRKQYADTLKEHKRIIEAEIYRLEKDR